MGFYPSLGVTVGPLEPSSRTTRVLNEVVPQHLLQVLRARREAAVRSLPLHVTFYAFADLQTHVVIAEAEAMPAKLPVRVLDEAN